MPRLEKDPEFRCNSSTIAESSPVNRAPLSTGSPSSWEHAEILIIQHPGQDDSVFFN
jgi:hypothetical protein